MIKAKLLKMDGIVFLRAKEGLTDRYLVRFAERIPKPRFYALRTWLSRWLPSIYPSLWRVWSFSLSEQDMRDLSGAK